MKNILIAIVLFVACGSASAQTSMVGVKAGMEKVYGTVESLKQDADFAKSQHSGILRLEEDYEHIASLYDHPSNPPVKAAIKRRLLGMNAVIVQFNKVQTSDETVARIKKLLAQTNAVLALVN